MMKQSKIGILVAPPVTRLKNIGDYIQSIAAQVFFEDFDLYIDRDNIANEGSDEYRTKVIMNAWWMWKAENWPPHPSIEPLMISMHISPLIADKMLSEDKLWYMQQHAPIGCRDTGTVEILRERGVESYFSGCLTLALGDKYAIAAQTAREGVIFVDPFVPIINKGHNINFKSIFRGVWAYLRYPCKVRKIMKINNCIRHKKPIKEYLRTAMFYASYSKIFDDQTLFNAEYITHIERVPKDWSNDKYMDRADELLKKYASAKLVVTSRIHCALPCLSLETPTIFIDSDEINSKKVVFNTPNRLGGLKELFHTIYHGKWGQLTPDANVNSAMNGAKISKNFTLENSRDFVALKEDMIARCKRFI